MRYLSVILASLLLACAAHAQGVANFFYQKGEVHVQRANPPAYAILPWQKEGTPQPSTDPVLDIQVDIRPASALTRQEGWVKLGTIAGLQGMMFIYDAPVVAATMAMEYHAPLDVLWVDATGTITQIAPKLVLAGNHEPIAGEKPAKALLMLPGGAADTNFIAPGDRLVRSEFFTPPPKLLTAPLTSGNK